MENISETVVASGLNRLARLATGVAVRFTKDLSKTVITPLDFTTTVSDLSKLHNEGYPADRGVITAAYTLLFQHGLDNFERCYVKAAEKRIGGWENWNPTTCQPVSEHDPQPAPGLIAGYAVLYPLLRKNYLGDSFPKLCQRLEVLLDRLVVVYGDRHDGIWGDRVITLEQMLYEGKLTA